MTDSDDIREPDQLDGVPLPEFRERVVGHEIARERILEQLTQARLPTGILLHGPRGIGKATLAFDIARKVFERTGDETANHIAAQVASGGYPNLRVLRKAVRDTGKGFYTVIRVDEVRSFIEELRMTRGRAGFRIAIIDPIDDCNANSMNALLKILEEPPPEMLFILVSHRPGGLLPTIRSRCHSVALRPLSDSKVREILSGDGADPSRIDAAVDLAGGRPRRGFEALGLADDGLLTGLRTWLTAPSTGPSGTYVKLAETLASDKDGAPYAFSCEMLLDWIAGEARAAAESGPAPARLASAGTLWDKATASFADAETYNLDARQALVGVLDAIRRHAQTHLTVAGIL